MMRLMRMWQLSLVGVRSLAACGGDGSRLAADEAKVTSVPKSSMMLAASRGPR